VDCSKVAESYPNGENVVKYLVQAVAENKAKTRRINQVKSVQKVRLL